ncbi:peptidase C15, pyroglutamyl peptidase I-like protein [Marasmius fiardii PR-910]|nr:peptidase C15, pyroglutamyl peptidase I-like protein [Marasmius fiardii PR-910]
MAPLSPIDKNSESERNRTINVLITGFGPFRNFTENPSWLAVKPLHNTVIPLDLHDPIIISDGQVVMTHATHPEPGGHGTSARTGGAHSATGREEPIEGETEVSDNKETPVPGVPQYAKITTLQVPVVYSDVLDIAPGLHRKPPVFPDAASDPLFTNPPPLGYDFILHVGVAGRGPMRVEKMAHKLGYYMKDATGELAPIVHSGSDGILTHDGNSMENGNKLGTVSVSLTAGLNVLPHPQSQQQQDSPLQAQGIASAVSVAEAAERERLGANMVEESGAANAGNGGRPLRGFGEGYRRFSDELYSDIDVLELVGALKRSGIESVNSSLDAGHYLCDFIYYCSLAEAQRNGKPYEKDQTTRVLFLHCPPADQPCSTEEVTETIKRIVVWVCGTPAGSVI